MQASVYLKFLVSLVICGCKDLCAPTPCSTLKSEALLQVGKVAEGHISGCLNPTWEEEERNHGREAGMEGTGWEMAQGDRKENIRYWVEGKD